MDELDYYASNINMKMIFMNFQSSNGTVLSGKHLQTNSLTPINHMDIIRIGTAPVACEFQFVTKTGSLTDGLKEASCSDISDQDCTIVNKSINKPMQALDERSAQLLK